VVKKHLFTLIVMPCLLLCVFQYIKCLCMIINKVFITFVFIFDIFLI
jgi:hypothetical protein